MAEDTLAPTDQAWSSYVIEGSDTLVITDAAVAVGSRTGLDALSLTETVAIVLVRVVTGSDTLSLLEAIIPYLPGSVEWEYHPFTGDIAIPATLTIPATGVTAFTLSYPTTSPTDILELRMPRFGDRDRLAANRINRETRGGTLVVFADAIWPTIQSLVVQFEGLSAVESQALLIFLEAHLGEEIGLYDWDHRYWPGVILNPDPVVCDGRRGYSAGFEFEGELASV
jgi:hypothetical protein